MIARLLKLIKNPHARFYGAVVLFILSIMGGVYSTLILAHGGYEKTLMGISWAAITITAVDVMATTDVRKEQ
jgi:hypothetical protein